MSDLTNLQGSTPVELIEEASGNSVKVSALGAASVAGAAADGVTASPNPVVVGGLDTSGVVKTITGLDTFQVKSLCTVTVPVISYLTSQNKLYSIALAVNAASGGADNAVIYIRNPNGSGKTLHILKVTCGIDINNVGATYKFTANPTVSANGTAQTAISRNVGGGAPTATALVTTLPTVSAIGSAIQIAASAQNTANTELMTQEYSIIVQPNNAVLVTVDPASNNRLSNISVVWAEI